MGKKKKEKEKERKKWLWHIVYKGPQTPAANKMKSESRGGLGSQSGRGKNITRPFLPWQRSERSERSVGSRGPPSGASVGVQGAKPPEIWGLMQL